MAENRMTPELRAELMGLLPFSCDARDEYIPECYKVREDADDGGEGAYIIPDEFWPTFSLRPLTRKELKALRQGAKAGKNIDEEERLRDLVGSAVMGWSNVIDLSDESIIEYVGDESGCDKELFGRIPLPVVTDLAGHILRISGLTAKERMGLSS